MISDKDLANDVAKCLLEVSAKVNETVVWVKERGTDEELKQYRRIAGRIMGEVLIEALNPLFARHPELAPPQLKEFYDRPSK